MKCIHTSTLTANNSEQCRPDNGKDTPLQGNETFNDRANALNMSITEYATATWDFLFAGKNRKPNTELPLNQVDMSHFNNPGSNQLSSTWIGHSSLLINIDGYKIITDPVFQKRVSVFGPTRFNGDVPVDIQHIPNVDAVIISHDHYDHLNKYSVQCLIEKTNTFIVPIAVGDKLMDWGVPRKNIVELDWWQEHRIDHQLTVIATPAQHFSGRGITDRNKTLWASWIIQTPLHKLFFGGDSGYFDGFKQIGDTYGPFDMTFLECGAYDKSWPHLHMFPEQTVQAHVDLKGAVLHPIHWATFDLALHPWYEPMIRATTAAHSKNVSLATPIVGETTVYRQNIPSHRWWEHAMI